MVAEANKAFAKGTTFTMRGHVLPVTADRAAAGGQTTGSMSDGGALVGSGLTLSQALRPVLQLEKMGARRVVSESGDTLVSPPSQVDGFWVGENQSAPVSSALFTAALRTPKEAGVRIRMSRGLWRHSGGVAEQEFRAILNRSIAATVEAGIITGTGTQNQPMGLVNDGQLQRRTFTGTGLPSREKVGEWTGEIAAAGGDVDSIAIMLPSVDYEASQKSVDDSVGDRPLVEIINGRRMMAGLPVAFSPFLPTGNVVVADFSRVSIAYLGAPQLLIDPITEAQSCMLNMTILQHVSYAVERRELLTIGKLTA